MSSNRASIAFGVCIIFNIHLPCDHSIGSLAEVRERLLQASSVGSGMVLGGGMALWRLDWSYFGCSLIVPISRGHYLHSGLVILSASLFAKLASLGHACMRHR